MALLVVTTTWKDQETNQPPAPEEFDVGNAPDIESVVCCWMSCPRAVFDQKVKSGELWIGQFVAGYWGRDGDKVTFRYHAPAPEQIETLTFSLVQTC